MTQRRCQECAHFYDKKLEVCPSCSAPKYAFNKWLRTASLNSELYKQASHTR